MMLDSMKGYFWVAVSKHHCLFNTFGKQIVHFTLPFKTVELKVCFRNSPEIQQFEKCFFKRTVEEIKRKPMQQGNGDLPGKLDVTDQLKQKPNLT
jgi:hypothetical protein